MLHFSVKHFASLDSRATIKVKNRLLEGCYNLYSFGHWGKKKKDHNATGRKECRLETLFLLQNTVSNCRHR